jgi:hypothetical protein
LNGQLNLDDATAGTGRSKSVMWLTAGITLLAGGEARAER